jgi:hypothetical protein
MKKYEVLLYEVQFNTLLYEVEARGEKEARRKALKEYKVDFPKDSWTTGAKIEGDKVYLVEGDND